MTERRDLLDWKYVDQLTWERAIEAALRHKADRRPRNTAAGKALGMLFFNPSLRTRTSMELAALELGAHATTLSPGQGTWDFAWEKGQPMLGSEAEHIVEAVGVLSRYYSALGVRLFASQSSYEADRAEHKLNVFADASSVPVINLESAFHHPCQALADAATIVRRFDEPRQKRFVLSWAYHPKPLPMAVPNSALLMATRLGMDVVLAHPEGFELDSGVMDLAARQASERGGSLSISHDQAAALDGADIVYAKAWAGPDIYTDRDVEKTKREAARQWRISETLMHRTNRAAFMHCLPVRRGVVVDDAVLDGPGAIHLDQAEFRLHAQKAILEYVWDL
jgi:N-acetylornithine carbamoyltransferase